MNAILPFSHLNNYSLSWQMIHLTSDPYNISLLIFWLQIFFYFRTPAYQDPNIQSDVTVQFQLYRPSNQSTSEAKSFTYTPRERVGKRGYFAFLTSKISCRYYLSLTPLLLKNNIKEKLQSILKFCVQRCPNDVIKGFK
jgi:hypothetical protein